MSSFGRISAITDMLAGLGLPEPSARLLLALLFAFVLAIVFRLVIVRLDAQVQHFFSALFGIGLVYFVIGTEIWHCFFDILVVYAALKVFGGTTVSLCVAWIVPLSHLLVGYFIALLAGEEYEITWTLPSCVLLFKLIGLATDLCDGARNPSTLSEDQKANAVSSLPPLLEVLGYCFFFGGVLVGPPVYFMRFRKLTSGKLYDINKTPSCVPAALIRLALGGVFAALYTMVSLQYPFKYLASDGFAERDLLSKLCLVLLITKATIWRYSTVWFIAEAACIMTGISFKSVRKDGTADWSAIRNVKLIKFELSITHQDVIDSFSYGTSQWVARYVFKRLKWLGNKSASHIVTMVFLGVWHGLWPGYLITFISEYFVITAERQFISTCKSVLGGSLYDFSWPIRLPLWVAAYILKNLIFLFNVTVFFLLSWTDCLKFMVAVHYYGYILVMGWIVLYGGYSMVFPPARKSKQQ